MLHIYVGFLMSGCFFFVACESTNQAPSKAASINKPIQQSKLAPETIFLADIAEILQKLRALEQNIDIATSEEVIDQKSFASLFNTVVYPRIVSMIEIANNLRPATPLQKTVGENISSYLDIRKTAANIVRQSTPEDSTWMESFNEHLNEAEKIAQQLRESIVQARKEHTEVRH